MSRCNIAVVGAPGHRLRTVAAVLGAQLKIEGLKINTLDENVMLGGSGKLRYRDYATENNTVNSFWDMQDRLERNSKEENGFVTPASAITYAMLAFSNYVARYGVGGDILPYLPELRSGSVGQFEQKRKEEEKILRLLEEKSRELAKTRYDLIVRVHPFNIMRQDLGGNGDYFKRSADGIIEGRLDGLLGTCKGQVIEVSGNINDMVEQVCKRVIGSQFGMDRYTEGLIRRPDSERAQEKYTIVFAAGPGAGKTTLAAMMKGMFYVNGWENVDLIPESDRIIRLSKDCGPFTSTTQRAVRWNWQRRLEDQSKGTIMVSDSPNFRHYEGGRFHTKDNASVEEKLSVQDFRLLSEELVASEKYNLVVTINDPFRTFNYTTDSMRQGSKENAIKRNNNMRRLVGVLYQDHQNRVLDVEGEAKDRIVRIAEYLNKCPEIKMRRDYHSRLKAK